jgi:hypothetical protein
MINFVTGGTLENGIYKGLDFSAYRAIPAINKSGLDYFSQSPAHYFANCLSTQRVEKEPTAAMKLGHAIHTICLEPADFEKRYICEPTDPPKRPSVTQINAKKPSSETLETIRFWAEFTEKAAGRRVLTAGEWEKCHRIRDAFRKHPIAQEFLSEGDFEVTLVWTDELEGVKCKARVDWLACGLILDLKSTISAAPDEFGKQATKLNYPCQSAFYLDGYRTLTGEDLDFIFTALEKEEPFASAWYHATEDVVSYGRQINRRHMKAYAQCLKSGVWPAYPEEIMDLKLPAWAFKQEQTKPIEGY